MPRTPKAVTEVMEAMEYFSDEAEFKLFVLEQLNLFSQVGYKATDEVGWVQIKCSCTRQDAATVVNWATRKKKVKKFKSSL